MELIETVRVERGRPILLPYHYRRLKRGALYLNFKFNFSFKEFEELIVRGSKKGEITLVRFSLKSDGSFSIESRECIKRSGVKLKSVYSIKKSLSSLSRFKTSAQLQLSRLAFEEAKSLGYDEAITYSTENFVCECAFSNIFFIKKGTLFTPSLRTGCLEGTRRSFIIDLCREMGVKVIEGLFRLKDILSSDEVFITSAREDTCPVLEIDGFKLNKPIGKPFYVRVREVIKWIEFVGAKSPYRSLLK